MVATLTATIIAPAKAGPASEPWVSVANATLPSIALPGLIDPQGQPVLSAPEAPETQGQPETAADTVPTAKPSGDLAALVAELRAPDAGSHELECLAPAGHC